MTVTFTVTQAQRLRELGAAPAVAETAFPTATERDEAFRRHERELVGAARRQLEELRAGPRTPRLRQLEGSLREALTGIGLVEVVTPAIISAEALAGMGIGAGDPLRDQVYWVEAGRCLRPMLAPGLYTLLRRLGRLWPRPFGIFEVGSCFRRDTRGSRHLSEFTMLNLVELGTGLEARESRLRELAAAIMHAADIVDYRFETVSSEIYGETTDIVAGDGIEVCSTAVGPLPLDDNWGVTEPWVGLGFGLERLLQAREGHDGIERVARSTSYLDGVRLNL